MTDDTKNNPNWAESRDALRQRAQQAKQSVEAHKESIYRRTLDEVRSDPPTHAPSQTGLSVHANSLGEKVLTQDERGVYADMKLETEQEMADFEHQLEDLRSNFDTTPDAAEKHEQLLEEREQLIEDTHHARGICTPAERQEAALEAIRQHNREREHVRPELVERQKLENGTDFSRYQVSEADLSRPDYPGPTPADDRIHEYLANGQHPASEPDLADRFEYVSRELSNETTNGRQIPQDFREQLRQRENDRLAEFVTEEHGPTVDPPEGSQGSGRHVASIRTHATDHHVVQAQESDRTLVVDGRNQPTPRPGQNVKVSVQRDAKGQLSAQLKVSRQNEASQGFER